MRHTSINKSNLKKIISIFINILCDEYRLKKYIIYYTDNLSIN